VVAPGASVGDFTVNNSATLGGTLAVEVNGMTSDRLIVTGALDISGAVLDVTQIGSGADGTAYVIASYGSLTGTFASVNGLPAGYAVDYAYNNGVSTNNIALVFSASPYDSYETANNISGAGSEADSDGDGIPNGIEFVLGSVSDPALNSSDVSKLPKLLSNGSVPAGAISLLPSGTTAADYIFFEHRLADAASDSDPFVQYGDGLTTWATASPGVSNVVAYVEDDGFATGIDRVIVCIPRNITGDPDRLFARLRVEIP
jgi:hypothetical protein